MAFFYEGQMSKEESVSIHVTAIATGYYKGKIIKTGEKFLFEGKLQNGRFPLWVKTPEEYKAKKVKKTVEKAEKTEDLV